ncbi:MAG: DUF423 domain-containing protein [Pseudomonas sp.]|nr:DUF423 domain-containing protein [Pseudomonas sp.]NLO52879.1 DUF423 domain-containing protein [Gammaproteobacteria bacterium]
MVRYGVFVAAVFGALAVLLGAFAAHGLKNTLSAEYLAVLHTGVQYQFIHALALLLVALLAQHHMSRSLVFAAIFFTLGIVLFSGSLYVLVLTPFKPGLITPLGGSLLVLGWLSLAVSAWRKA